MDLTMNAATRTTRTTATTSANPNANTAAASGRKGQWTGRIMSGLMVAFLLFDSVGKLLRLDPVVKGTAVLGYPTSAIVPLGIVLLACVALYLIPRTAILGAVLLTGYLGGAIASHVRVGDPLFSHVLFPVYVAALLWGGLYLRDRRVRPLLAPRV